MEKAKAREELPVRPQGTTTVPTTVLVREKAREVAASTRATMILPTTMAEKERVRDKAAVRPQGTIRTAPATVVTRREKRKDVTAKARRTITQAATAIAASGLITIRAKVEAAAIPKAVIIVEEAIMTKAAAMKAMTVRRKKNSITRTRNN